MGSLTSRLVFVLVFGSRIVAREPARSPAQDVVITMSSENTVRVVGISIECAKNFLTTT
jgi:hypothetical protein